MTDLDADRRVDQTESRGNSNFIAYLIGGLVIALGLLAFLFYDGGGSDVSTTGSTNERPAASDTSSPGANTAPPASTTSPPAMPQRPANPQ